MTNTINNVPRDWVERVHALLYEIAHQQGQIGEEAECLGSFIPGILSAPVQQVSVPVEPTIEMAEALYFDGKDYTHSKDFDDFKEAWAQLLLVVRKLSLNKP